MDLTRTSGILMHPTSLPAPHGIGTVGEPAQEWIEWLGSTGCRVWQVLPLAPTGYGDSPYQAFSSFAGNALMVDLDLLVHDGLVPPRRAAHYRPEREDRVDFGELIPAKAALLADVADRIGGGHRLRAEFEAFSRAESSWLDDYALFRAIKDSFAGRPWHTWPSDVRDRDSNALDSARRALSSETHRYSVRQWLFYRQWAAVRDHAASRGIEIFGDIPLYVAHDSADVWTNRSLFELTPDGHPREVAGVPPDYFSPTGQLWGNPIFRWEQHAATGYRWWIERVRAALRLVDTIRVDHFRGFADYWAIPGGAETAVTGEWRDGPGRDVFDALQSALGSLPIIAEDLGDLSPAVTELRDELGLAGMNILQFAFDDDESNPFLPEHITERSVAYTGTHDNDTTLGWYDAATPAERAQLRTYIDADRSTINWALIELAWETKAFLVVAPTQDVLGLGTAHRMNTPGVPAGNWRWRATPGSLTDELAARIRELNVATGRLASTTQSARASERAQP